MRFRLPLRRLHRPLKAVAVAVFLFASAGFLEVEAQQARVRARAARHPALPAAAVPGAGQRVLVFAPHPDDETLGAGGLICQARRRGAAVRVVFFTRGDGYSLCATVRYGQHPGADAMQRLGHDRQGEALAALAALGVDAAHATFLGYPDRGLDDLWLDHWSPAAPYVSRYTGLAAVSGAPSFRPGAPYAGESVVQDVTALLERVRPDFVYYPDAADDHPDHWAAHCFVRMALERWKQSVAERSPVARTYLVHRGDWPEPRGEDARLFLSPPTPLIRTHARWETLDLTPAAVAAKRRALRAHRTQLALGGSFLPAFLRRNELLGVPEAPPALPALPSTCELPDSLFDRWSRTSCGPADFAEVEAGLDRAWLRLSGRLREQPASWIEYSLYWKALDGPLAQDSTQCFRLKGGRPEGEPPGSVFVSGDEITISIPRSRLRSSRLLMVAAVSRAGGLVVDQTPWRVVRIGE